MTDIYRIRQAMKQAEQRVKACTDNAAALVAAARGKEGPDSDWWLWAASKWADLHAMARDANRAHCFARLSIPSPDESLVQQAHKQGLALCWTGSWVLAQDWASISEAFSRDVIYPPTTTAQRLLICNAVLGDTDWDGTHFHLQYRRRSLCQRYPDLDLWRIEGLRSPDLPFLDAVRALETQTVM